MRDGERQPAPVAGRQPMGAAGLAEGYGRALLAADVFFGGFVIFMAVLVLVAWRRGDAPFRDFIGILLFLVVNILFSEASRRIRRPRLVEGARLVVGGVLAAVVYVLVSGPLAPWWPGFMVLCLGAAIGFGLLTQRPIWGRLAVIYYLTIYSVMTLVRPGPIDWYSFLLHVGVMAMAGFMFAEIMSLLGETLQHEYERSLELRAARDALFAEVEVAQEIQTLLLPRAPELPGCEVVGRMVPASEVGGDYYDVLESNGRRFLAIGDVSGHGLTSGLTMMMTSTTLVGALEAAPSATLAELYQVLNRCVRRNVARMDFSVYMTFVLLEYLGDGHFNAVGRHLPLLVYRHASASVESIELDGMWLGVVDHLEPNHLKQVNIRLEPGDQLFLYTDGIVEQFGRGEMFGFERLSTILAREGVAGSAARTVESVLGECQRFAHQQEDDVTMLVVRREIPAHATVNAILRNDDIRTEPSPEQSTE